MRKYFVASAIIAGLTLGSIPAFAQTATSTPKVGGHRPYVAGFVDSIHGKGAWVLDNTAPSFGQISYVVESPKTPEESRIKTLWKTWIAQFAN